MQNKAFKQLVEAVKKDPSLLHSLAFGSAKGGQKLAFIPETERTALAGLQAENLLANALGLLERENAGQCTTTCQKTGDCGITSKGSLPADISAETVYAERFRGGFYSAITSSFNSGACGGDTTCSCTSGTCGGETCGGSTCSVTCSGDSCGNTCGDSCSNTSNYRFDNLEMERILARQLNQRLIWK